MQEEYNALQRNRPGAVPRPPRANVITGKWVFKHKLGSDGTLERYKARWVVRGFRQRAGDVGITLRVTDIALSCAAQLEAHEDTRQQGGPLGRC
ncbi:hypothetical protein QYE76_009236 [Lolium multiflorum]|uniref:Reverse transcriptase Ty1/copia-type domain-containing protein n=1 Tax=Lolium multiflorum TaxID=4521 RepID=A0AAD8X3E3_LOLMU|nr:hypothetical protein QYE76_009236 [Lolium multiflorum]